MTLWRRRWSMVMTHKKECSQGRTQSPFFLLLNIPTFLFCRAFDWIAQPNSSSYGKSWGQSLLKILTFHFTISTQDNFNKCNFLKGERSPPRLSLNYAIAVDSVRFPNKLEPVKVASLVEALRNCTSSRWSDWIIKFSTLYLKNKTIRRGRSYIQIQQIILQLS